MKRMLMGLAAFGLCCSTLGFAGRFVEKRSIVFRDGRDMASSFNAVLIALREKEYFIEKVEPEQGLIVTRRRHSGDWWWYFRITVEPDGTTTFEPAGSPNVMSGNRMHITLERYATILSDKMHILLHYYEQGQLKILAGKYARD